MRLFPAWCQVQGVIALPASVADVVRFVSEYAHIPAEVLQAELEAIDERHEALLYAPPCKARAVIEAFNAAHPVEPPRSWPKDEGPLFASLPKGVQAIVARREAERDREVKRCQTDASQWRKFKQEQSNAEIEA
jgi:hypothetical protein